VNCQSKDEAECYSDKSCIFLAFATDRFLNISSCVPIASAHLRTRFSAMGVDDRAEAAVVPMCAVEDRQAVVDGDGPSPQTSSARRRNSVEDDNDDDPQPVSSAEKATTSPSKYEMEDPVTCRLRRGDLVRVSEQ